MWRQRTNHALPSREKRTIGNSEAGDTPLLGERPEHRMQFADSRGGRERAPSIEGMNRGEKLFSTERSSARELGIRAGVHELRHATNMIVVPMCGNDQSDSGRGVDTDRQQIIQRLWFPGISDARIHDDPPALTNVYDDTLAVARSQKREFDLIRARSGIGLTAIRHAPKAAWIRAAQAFPAC